VILFFEFRTQSVSINFVEFFVLFFVIFSLSLLVTSAFTFKLNPAVSVAKICDS